MYTAVGIRFGKTAADVTRSAAEIQHAVAGQGIAKAFPKQSDEMIMRFAEIGASIGQRLFGRFHQFGFGDTLHGYQ